MTCLKKNKNALARCMLTFGLVVSLAITVGVADGDGEDPGIENPNFYFRLRPRSGHFANVDGYLDLYEEYFNNVVRYSDEALKSIDINDWRAGRPTGEQCVVFLEDFQVRNYRLAKPFDIIILDACLDWLLSDPTVEDSEAKTDYDMLSSESKKDYAEVKKDPKLKEIFESTMFKENKIPKSLTEKLHEYFSRLLKINADNPRNWCHSLWVESYNDFIEEIYLNNCSEEDEDEECVYYGLEGSESDSYLSLIRDSTRANSKVCYNVIQKQMVGIMHKDYQEKSGLNLFVTSKLAKQAKEKKWGQEMVKILQLASGQTESDKPIVLAKVVESLNNIKEDDDEAVEKFTEALGEFAIHNVNIKSTENDEKGRKRYRRAMEKLCSPYINPKNFLKNSKSTWHEDPEAKKPFEFYNLIYNLIRMTNHEDIYGISKIKFENDVVDRGWVPLYLATFACQIISTTWGTIDYTTNQAAFQVALRKNAHILIDDWPLEEITNRLVIQEEEDELEDGKPRKISNSFMKGLFGNKHSKETSTKPSAMAQDSDSDGSDSDDESDDEEDNQEHAGTPAEAQVAPQQVLDALGVSPIAPPAAQPGIPAQAVPATGQPAAMGQPQAGQPIGYGQQQQQMPQGGFNQAQMGGQAYGMPQQQQYGYQQQQMAQPFNGMQQHHSPMGGYMQNNEPVAVGIPVQPQTINFAQQAPVMGVPVSFTSPIQTSVGFVPQQQSFLQTPVVASFVQPGPQTLAFAQQYTQMLGQLQPTSYTTVQQPQYAPQQVVSAQQPTTHTQPSSSRTGKKKQRLFGWLPKSWLHSSKNL